MGLDIVQNVLAGNLIEGIPEVQLEEDMVNLLRVPLDPRTGGMHSCLYPTRHGYANLCWPEMLPGHLPDMCHEAFGGESPQSLANCNGAYTALGLWQREEAGTSKGGSSSRVSLALSKQPNHRGQVLEKGISFSSCSGLTQVLHVQPRRSRGSVSGEGPQGLGHRIRHHFRCKRQIRHRAGSRRWVGRVQAAKGLDCFWRVRAKAR